MEIVRVEGVDERWEDLVWDSPSGTIFSSRKFLGYHPASRFDRLDLAVKDGADLVCVIAGGKVAGDDRAARWFRSPVGASFGGFVFREGCSLRVVSEAVETVTAELRQSGFEGAHVILPPACYSSRQDRGLEFALGKAGYRVVARDATAVIDLDRVGDDDLDPALRRNLRKAEKAGVHVRAGTAVDAFYGVLCANLAEKGARPTHSLEELQLLLRLFPDRMILLEATVGEKVVGGCLVLLCNSRVGLAFYICDDGEHSGLRVSEAAIEAARGLLKRAGYKYFDLGTVSKGDEVNWGLARFKSKFCAITQVREHFFTTLGGAP
jgi:lipid II:glycine glycyltransferase (peptidoglycan interpeptide bridge formation enzyme)